MGFAQAPTPTSRVDLLNAFGTGDFDHDGRADDLTVSTTVNANPVKTNLSQSASAGQKAIFIGAASGFNQKDEVAIIQMSGTNAGTWETAYVTDTRPEGRLLLHRTLTNTYTVDASSKAQVVKVPHYRNVRVQNGGVLTVNPWNGSSGGVMFLRAQNDFDVQNGGKVDVSGLGFRGGTGGSGVSMQCGDSFYCPAGTSCWPYPEGESVIYECRADRGLQVSDPNGEGPQGVGGRSGATGNHGWNGDTRTWGGGSRQYYVNGGGGGGGAGGGGAGGSLASSTSANGQDGGSGGYGVAATGGCFGSGTPTSETYPATGETILYYRYHQNAGCYNECKKFESNNEVLYSISYSCSRHFTYYETQYGPPGRGRPGGAGGLSNSALDFSGNKIFLGPGGGSGGAGGIGGSGGFGGGIGGPPGSGGSGGFGGGAVVIFAKTINIAGEIVSSGRSGQTGTDGGNGGVGYSYGCSGDCSRGGGGGGAGGGGGGGGSGGTIRLYAETATLGTDRVKALGAVGAASGAGGAGGAGGWSNAGGSGSGGGGGGNSTRGGTGSNGAAFVTYTRSFSGSSSSTDIRTNQTTNITKQ